MLHERNVYFFFLFLYSDPDDGFDNVGSSGEISFRRDRYPGNEHIRSYCYNLVYDLEYLNMRLSNSNLIVLSNLHHPFKYVYHNTISLFSFLYAFMSVCLFVCMLPKS